MWTDDASRFAIKTPRDLWQVGSRFVASMFMHINVGKETL